MGKTIFIVLTIFFDCKSLTFQVQYFNVLFPSVSQVTESETIIVYDLPFFDHLGALLEATPKRVIANYIMWRVAAASSDYLTDQVKKLQLEYFTVLNGQQTEKPRWKECLSLVTQYFSIAASALYVRIFFDEKSKDVALDMVNGIRDEFEEILATVPWMDEETRQIAIMKSKAIYSHIGYPDELMDDGKLIDFYKQVDVDENKFLESILSVKMFEADKTYEKLRQGVNKTDWKTHSNVVDVNAFYSVIENSIRKKYLSKS